MTDSLDNLAVRFAGKRVPGGCEDCDAYQTFEREADGTYAVRVHHDDTCPWLNARTSR